MPIPNSEVVSALFESYINIRRKKEWTLTESEPFTLPTDPKPAHKLNVCIEILQQVQKAKKLCDWMKIIDVLAEQERIEFKDVQSDSSRYFGLANYFMDRPLLLETIRAARVYVLSQLELERDFIQSTDDLNNQKAILATAILDGIKTNTSKEIIATLQQRHAKIREQIEARNHSIDYLATFFNEVIKVRDPQAAELKEQTFKDYEAHIRDKTRLRTTTKSILTSIERQNQHIAKTALATETTTPTAPLAADKPADTKPMSALPVKSEPLVQQLLVEKNVAQTAGVTKVNPEPVSVSTNKITTPDKAASNLPPAISLEKKDEIKKQSEVAAKSVFTNTADSALIKASLQAIQNTDNKTKLDVSTHVPEIVVAPPVSTRTVVPPKIAFDKKIEQKNYHLYPSLISSQSVFPPIPRQLKSALKNPETTLTDPHQKKNVRFNLD